MGCMQVILLTAILILQKGYIPLHFASVRGDAEMVKALVEAELNVDVKQHEVSNTYLNTFCVTFYLHY